MVKYIDADKLKKDFDRLCDIVCQYSKKQRDVMCVSCPLGDAFELLDNQPAVEVVRCRECAYRKHEQPGMVYCPHMIGGWVCEDWFCAGGKKE